MLSPNSMLNLPSRPVLDDGLEAWSSCCGCSDVDFSTSPGFNVVLTDETQQFTHGRMPQRAAGKWLDRNARRGKCPGFAQTIYDRTGVKAPSGGVEIARRGLQNIVTGSPAHRREIGGDRPFSAA